MLNNSRHYRNNRRDRHYTKKVIMIHIVGPRASGKSLQAIIQARLNTEVWNANKKQEDVVPTFIITEYPNSYKDNIRRLLSDTEEFHEGVIAISYSELFLHAKFYYNRCGSPLFIDDLENFKTYLLKNTVVGSPTFNTTKAFIERYMVGYTASDTNALKDFIDELDLHLQNMGTPGKDRYILLRRA